MRKIGLMIACALCAVCLAAPALANGTLMNLYIEKETLSETQTQEKENCSKNHELRVRMNTRVEDGKILLEVTNGTEKAMSYYALGAVLSDAQGCMVDVLDEKTVDIAAGESVTLEKELLPYVTAEMLEGATLDIFGYVFAKNLEKR